jgi:hypothetical protein
MACVITKRKHCNGFWLFAKKHGFTQEQATSNWEALSPIEQEIYKSHARHLKKTATFPLMLDPGGVNDPMFFMNCGKGGKDHNIVKKYESDCALGVIDPEEISLMDYVTDIIDNSHVQVK